MIVCARLMLTATIASSILPIVILIAWPSTPRRSTNCRSSRR